MAAWAECGGRIGRWFGLGGLGGFLGVLGWFLVGFLGWFVVLGVVFRWFLGGKMVGVARRRRVQERLLVAFGEA